jgi:hypothetical protein
VRLLSARWEVVPRDEEEEEDCHAANAFGWGGRRTGSGSKDSNASCEEEEDDDAAAVAGVEEAATAAAAAPVSSCGGLGAYTRAREVRLDAGTPAAAMVFPRGAAAVAQPVDLAGFAGASGVDADAAAGVELLAALVTLAGLFAPGCNSAAAFFFADAELLFFRGFP